MQSVCVPSLFLHCGCVQIVNLTTILCCLLLLIYYLYILNEHRKLHNAIVYMLEVNYELIISNITTTAAAEPY